MVTLHRSKPLSDWLGAFSKTSEANLSDSGQATATDHTFSRHSEQHLSKTGSTSDFRNQDLLMLDVAVVVDACLLACLSLDL